MRQAILILAATMVMITLAACGGGSAQEGKAKARPLPQDPQALRPGEYQAVVFKPSLSFHVGKGWLNTEPQLPDFIEVGQLGGFMRFANVKEVWKPGTTNVVDALKDLVGWLEYHPYLKTSKPQPVTLGGVKGEQIDVLVDHLPKDSDGFCGSDCLDIFNLSSGDQIGYFREGRNRRVIVLGDVKGDTVVIWFSAPPDEFAIFTPKAQKVIDSVKWGRS